MEGNSPDPEIHSWESGIQRFAGFQDYRKFGGKQLPMLEGFAIEQ
jgi:hypothetical protein